jgi:hypothetical protein
MKSFMKFVRLGTILIACSLLAGCDDVRVYGSVGYSNYSGYGGYHGGGMRTGVTVGGRIY